MRIGMASEGQSREHRPANKEPHATMGSRTDRFWTRAEAVKPTVQSASMRPSNRHQRKGVASPSRRCSPEVASDV